MPPAPPSQGKGKKRKGEHLSKSAAKRKRIAQRDRVAVRKATAMIDPVEATFEHLVLNWEVARLMNPGWLISDRTPTLPLLHSSLESYCSIFKCYVLEETRCILAQALGKLERGFLPGDSISERKAPGFPLRLTGYDAPGSMSQYTSGTDATLLTFDNTAAGVSLSVGQSLLLSSLGSAHRVLGIVAPMDSAERGRAICLRAVLPKSFGKQMCSHPSWTACVLGNLTTMARSYAALYAGGAGVSAHVLSQLVTATKQKKAKVTFAAAEENPAPTRLHDSLNETQNAAVAAFRRMTEGISLVQGPPGTGKTTTIATAIQEAAVNGRVVVAAPSNQAVRELCRKFMQLHPTTVVALLGIEGMLRDDGDLRGVFVHGWAEQQSTIIQRILQRLVVAQGANDEQETKFSLGDLKKTMVAMRAHAPLYFEEYCASTWTSAYSHIKSFLRDHEHCSKLPVQTITRLMSTIRSNIMSTTTSRIASTKLEKEMLSTARVVFCTLSTSGREYLQDELRANVLVVDEAGQAVETETLIVVHAVQPKKILLVGDPRQLPATVMSEVASRRGFCRSLLERLATHMPCQLLKTQYRMHPAISRLPNELFYNKKLKDARGLSDELVRPWHPAVGPYVFVDVEGIEQCLGSSYHNDAEIGMLARVVEYLCKKHHVDEGQIRAITFYKSQAAQMKEHFERMGYGNVVVATVDSFQGSESDIVLLSFVRANAAGGVGFLKDYRRLNVALTRARSTLVMVGHSPTLCRDVSSDVHAVVRNAQQREVIVSAASFISRL